ncbi:MAG: fibronectin type III domain-containing protein [Pseudomonadota bacterium]
MLASPDSSPPKGGQSPEKDADDTLFGGGMGNLTGQVPIAPVLRVDGVGATTISLGWNKVDYADGYKLYYASSLRGTFDAATTSFLEPGLSQGRYCYQLSAFNSNGESPRSSPPVCGDILPCTNTAGPTIEILPTITESVYPSVANTALRPVAVGAALAGFHQSNWIDFNFRIADDVDGCGDLNYVTTKVFVHGSSTRWEKSTPEFEGYSGYHNNTLTAPVGPTQFGYFDIELTVSDGIHPAFTAPRQANYFEIKALPGNSELPSNKTLTLSKSAVCPKENFTLTYEFDDDSLWTDTSKTTRALGNEWLRVQIFQAGVTQPVHDAYAKSGVASLHYDDNPSEAELSVSYTAFAYDYQPKGAGAQTSVIVKQDTGPPTVDVPRVSPAPIDGKLVADTEYTVTSTPHDDCPVSYQLSYSLNYGSFVNFSGSFKPGTKGCKAGDTVKFRAIATDSMGNKSVPSDSQIYTVTAGQTPTLGISVSPPPAPRTTYAPQDSVTIILTATDDDMPTLKLVYLQMRQVGMPSWEDLVPQNGLFSAYTPKTIKLSAFGGFYDFRARVQDKQLKIVDASKQIQVVESATSPLVVYLDINRDGSMDLGKNPMTEMTQFDIDGDGVKEWTHWLNKGDAFLMLPDGPIDDFHDFASLDELKAHGDVIDSDNPLYGSVRLWTDADSNGVADSGELRSLAEANVHDVVLSPSCGFHLNP